MTKRLLDEEGLQAEDEQLADLLRSAAPFVVDPFRKRRVLVRIERIASTPSRKARFWLRPAIALTLLISGSAAAAIGHRYAAPGAVFWGLSGAPSATATQPQRASTPSAPRPLASAAAVSAEPNIPALDSAASATAVSAEPTLPALDSAASATPNARPLAPKNGLRARSEATEDASAVVEAIQALRAGRDPTKAQGLLDDYLKTNPRGVLAGDALALSIEAASARKDPRAADYARRYLAVYPKGKYRELAKRALEQR